MHIQCIYNATRLAVERVEKKRGKKKETREDEVRGRARLQRHELNGKMKTQDVIAEDIKNGKRRRKGVKERGREGGM